MPRPPALVVDDYASMRSVVIEVLKRAGFTEIHQAGNGQLALAKVLEHKKIGLIVSDWYMPTMDGLDLLRALKANPQTAHIPVLMITAEGQRDNVLDAMQSGAAGYIVNLSPRPNCRSAWRACFPESPPDAGGIDQLIASHSTDSKRSTTAPQ